MQLWIRYLSTYMLNVGGLWIDVNRVIQKCFRYIITPMMVAGRTTSVVLRSSCSPRMLYTVSSSPVASNQRPTYVYIRVITKLYKQTISVSNRKTENRNDSDLVQAFLKKWWVESDFKAPNLPLSLRFKVSSSHYNSIYNNNWTKQVKQLSVYIILLFPLYTHMWVFGLIRQGSNSRYTAF